MTNIIFLLVGTAIGYSIKYTIDTYKNLKESKRILDEINSIDFFEFEPMYKMIVDENNKNIGTVNTITHELIFNSNTTKPPLKETLKQQLKEAIEKEDYLLAKELHNKINLLNN